MSRFGYRAPETAGVSPSTPPTLIFLADDRQNQELRLQLTDKLTAYRERRERFRTCGWDRSQVFEHRFWWFDIEAKILILSRVLEGQRLIKADLYTELSRDSTWHPMVTITYDGRQPFDNAFGVVSQYVTGVRAA